MRLVPVKCLGVESVRQRADGEVMKLCVSSNVMSEGQESVSNSSSCQSLTGPWAQRAAYWSVPRGQCQRSRVI